MRSFWWFKENSIAGMARPGFNKVHWFEMPFDEGVVMGWIGQQTPGDAKLETFQQHLKTYAPKIFKFYNLTPETGAAEVKKLEDPQYFLLVLQRLNQRTHFFENLSVSSKLVHFEVSRERLAYEAEFLKSKNISQIISLTEHHHNKSYLEQHFKLHHIAIADLGAPKIEQVHELADIVKQAQTTEKKLVVHCLAGIGRTSTMLITAHLLLGKNFEELKALIAKQNPTFEITGAQGEFIHQVAGLNEGSRFGKRS